MNLILQKFFLIVGVVSLPLYVSAEVSVCTSSQRTGSLQIKKGSKCQSGSKRAFLLPEASDVVGSFSGRKKPGFYAKSEVVAITPLRDNHESDGTVETFQILCNSGDIAVAGGYQFPTTAGRISAGGSSAGAEIVASFPWVQDQTEPQGWVIQTINFRDSPSTLILWVSCQDTSK